MAKHTIKNKGLLPLGLIVSLSITLTGFEYMSSETIKTKKLTGHIMAVEDEVFIDPIIPKPDMPKMDAPEEKPRTNPSPISPVNPIGPIEVSPNPPSDPVNPIWEPSIDPIPKSFGKQEIIIDVIEDANFLVGFPTYEDLLSIENDDDRRTQTGVAVRRNVQTEATFPEIARQLNIQGTVYVSFVVDKEGNITEVKLERGIHESLDKEAIRAVKKLPNMIPGKKGNSPVRVRYIIPVKFALK